jgi:hypothetical protein
MVGGVYQTGGGAARWIFDGVLAGFCPVFQKRGFLTGFWPGFGFLGIFDGFLAGFWVFGDF